MTITTKFNPYQTVFIMHEGRLVRCTINAVKTSSRDSGHSDDPYITEITYNLSPESGNSLPVQMDVPERNIWKDSEDFLEQMTKIADRNKEKYK